MHCYKKILHSSDSTHLSRQGLSRKFPKMAPYLRARNNASRKGLGRWEFFAGVKGPKQFIRRPLGPRSFCDALLQAGMGKTKTVFFVLCFAKHKTQNRGAKRVLRFPQNVDLPREPCKGPLNGKAFQGETKGGPGAGGYPCKNDPIFTSPVGTYQRDFLKEILKKIPLINSYRGGQKVPLVPSLAISLRKIKGIPSRISLRKFPLRISLRIFPLRISLRKP